MKVVRLVGDAESMCAIEPTLSVCFHLDPPAGDNAYLLWLCLILSRVVLLRPLRGGRNAPLALLELLGRWLLGRHCECAAFYFKRSGRGPK